MQYIFLGIGATIALVGLARGYDKELGNSIILMIAVAFLSFLENRYETQISAIASGVLGVDAVNANTFLFLLFAITFIVIVFMSYSGITMNFGGSPLTGFGGQLISLGVGIFNGYLIAGTLWYYANKFGYPFISGAAQLPPGNISMELLPQNVFPDPLYWIVPAAVLLILRVRG